MVVELKNGLQIDGSLTSVDQFLNLKLTDIRVVDEERYPQLVRSCRMMSLASSDLVFRPRLGGPPRAGSCGGRRHGSPAGRLAAGNGERCVRCQAAGAADRGRRVNQQWCQQATLGLLGASEPGPLFPSGSAGHVNSGPCHPSPARSPTVQPVSKGRTLPPSPS